MSIAERINPKAIINQLEIQNQQFDTMRLQLDSQYIQVDKTLTAFIRQNSSMIKLLKEQQNGNI